MPLFSAKLDYALRAAIDLAMQPPGEACQSREIAARQNRHFQIAKVRGRTANCAISID